MAYLTDLPDEIILRIVNQLAIPSDYKGLYVDQRQSLRTSSIEYHGGPKYHLHDVLALSTTNKLFRALLGSLIWHDFVLNDDTFNGHDEKNDKSYQTAFGAFIKNGVVKSSILDFVTIFEPLIPRACLSAEVGNNDAIQNCETIQLVNPITLPSLKRLIINFNNHRDQTFSFLGLQLQKYQHPIKISATMTSAVNLSLLQSNILPLVDCLNYTITSIPKRPEIYSPLETSIFELENLTLVSSVTDQTACKSLLDIVVNMINNNSENLETLDLQLFPMNLKSLERYQTWCVPSIKRLACQDIHLASFPSQKTKACRNLDTLHIKFNRTTNLGQLEIPSLLTGLSSLEVLQIPERSKPEEYTSFFSKLQKSNPYLKSITFNFFSVPEALALAPVISKLESFKVNIMQHRGAYGDIGWPMVAGTASSFAAETKEMPVNRILDKVACGSIEGNNSSVKEFAIPLNAHELISYPLLKKLLLESPNENLQQNESCTSQLSTIWLNATWPRVSETLSPAQFENRNQCLEFNYMSPHVAFQVYNPVCLKPVDDREEQSYLEDLFYGFNDEDSFQLTDFCHLIRDLDTLGEASDHSQDIIEYETAILDDGNVLTNVNNTTPSFPLLCANTKPTHKRKNSKVKLTMFLDVPEWQQVEMMVKIDVHKLYELLRA